MEANSSGPLSSVMVQVFFMVNGMAERFLGSSYQSRLCGKTGRTSGPMNGRVE